MNKSHITFLKSSDGKLKPQFRWPWEVSLETTTDPMEWSIQQGRIQNFFKEGVDTSGAQGGPGACPVGKTLDPPLYRLCLHLCSTRVQEISAKVHGHGSIPRQIYSQSLWNYSTILRKLLENEIFEMQQLQT